MSEGDPTTEEKRARWVAELNQINADTRLKLRQHSTEVWKIVIVSVIATAIATTVILLTIPSRSGW